MIQKWSERPEWKLYQDLMVERPELFAEMEQLSIVTDRDVVDRFVEESGKRIGVLYKSEYHLLVVDLVCGENGRLFAYERAIPAVEHGAVVVLTIFRGKFVLLKQWRHAIRSVQYAFPRGFGEKNLTAEENARKELREELGTEICKCEYLGTVIADSGFLGNQVSVFACEVPQVERKYRYEGIEDVVMLTPEEMDKWIAGEKITDGFTLAAYGMYQCRKKEEV